MSSSNQSAFHTSETKRLIPLTKWPEFHPWPTVAGLRSIVFNAEKNGFSKCIVKIGGRILISESEFFEWCVENSLSLENQKGKHAAKSKESLVCEA